MLKLGVVFGGRSSERNISFLSGKTMFEVLDSSGEFGVLPLLLGRDGDMYQFSKTCFQKSELDLDQFLEFIRAQPETKTISNFQIADLKLDCVVLGLHGEEGEDGRIQGMLDLLRIPYTGSGHTASSLAMDKLLTYFVYSANGISTPVTTEYSPKLDAITFAESCKIPFPIFAKPTTGGSSVGTKLLKTKPELIAFLQAGKERTILQEFIKGREFSCGILEKSNGEIVCLPATEIVSNDEYFDFSNKYSDQGAKEITPANVSPEMMNRLQELALKAHTVLGCRGYSRTDILWKEDQFYVLETNTLPGFTKRSIFPEQAKHLGISILEILKNLVAVGIQNRF